MLEFVVTFIFVFMTFCAYLMTGFHIAGLFGEAENNRYIYLWPIVIAWLLATVTEDMEWRRVLRRIWWRLKEPFYTDLIDSADKNTLRKIFVNLKGENTHEE